MDHYLNELDHVIKVAGKGEPVVLVGHALGLAINRHSRDFGLD